MRSWWFDSLCERSLVRKTCELTVQASLLRVSQIYMQHISSRTESSVLFSCTYIIFASRKSFHCSVTSVFCEGNSSLTLESLSPCLEIVCTKVSFFQHVVWHCCKTQLQAEFNPVDAHKGKEGGAGQLLAPSTDSCNKGPQYPFFRTFGCNLNQHFGTREWWQHWK